MLSIRKYIPALIILFSLSADALCQDSGGYAGAFLRMGLSARVKAMGGAFTALADDGAAQYYNPAGLPFFTNRQVTLSYRSLSLDRSFNYIGFASPLKPTAGLALGWIHAGVDNIEARGFSGEVFDTITDSENAFYFSFANRFSDKVAAGFSGKILYHKLFDLTAKGVGFDFGILVKPVKNLSVGMLVKDIKSKLKWNSNDIYERGSSTIDEFPVVFNAGASYLIETYDVIAVADASKSSKEDSWRFHTGAEKTFHKRFYLRAGMNHTDPAFGAGALWRWKSYSARIDYAWVSVENDQRENHIISLNLGI